MPLSSGLLLMSLFLVPCVAAAVCAECVRRKVARRLGRLSGPPRWAERAAVWIPALALLVLVVACAGYGWLIEPGWIEVRTTELRVERAVLGEPRFRIAHLTDLHLESLGDRERDVLAAVREAQPHLIVLTGDYMNVRSAQADFVTFLRALQAPLGVYGVGGNWDSKFPIADLFASAGHHYLRDDYALVQGAGAKLLIVGQDYFAGRTLGDLLEGASEDSFRLFLHHTPDATEQLTQGRVDLMLCGHTHGGQVRLPFYGALAGMTRRERRFQQGLYRVEPPHAANPAGTALYVSRGIGTTGIGPAVRFLARPEVAIIELVAP